MYSFRERVRCYSVIVTTYPFHRHPFLFLHSEFYRYLRLRLRRCRCSVLSSTFSKFPKGISFLSVLHVRGATKRRGLDRRETPFRRVLRGGGRTREATHSGKIWSNYHKNKIKRAEYVYGRAVHDRRVAARCRR